MKTSQQIKWSAASGVAVWLLLSAGCATGPVVTSTRMNKPKTSNRVKCTLTLVDFAEAPKEIEDAWREGICQPWSGEKTKKFLGSIREKSGTKIKEYPPLIAADGEKVEWNDQKPMRYVSEYNKPDLDKKIYWPTPKTFATRGVGLKWSILPTIEDPNANLKLEVDDTHFVEWVEYSTCWAVNGESHKKAIKQPVFNKRALNTFIALKNGQFVILGGLFNQEQKLPDGKKEFYGSVMILSVSLLDEKGKPIPPGDSQVMPAPER